MTLGQSSHPDTWGVDISVFSSFNLDLNEVAAGTVQGGGIRDPIINGKAELNVDTSSLSAVYIFVLMMEIGGIAGFYMLLQLRAVFTSLAAGDKFDLKNSARIRKSGYVAIGWALIVLSGVLNAAASINESHQLTI